MGQTYLFGVSPAKLREISFKVKEQVLGGHLYTTTGILKTNKAELHNRCETRPLLSGIVMTEGEGKALSATSECKISHCMVYIVDKYGYMFIWMNRNMTEQQKSNGQNAYVYSCFF